MGLYRFIILQNGRKNSVHFTKAYSTSNRHRLMADGFRLEIMVHSEVSDRNEQPARMFFDIEVDDVHAELVSMN